MMIKRKKNTSYSCTQEFHYLSPPFLIVTLLYSFLVYLLFTWKTLNGGNIITLWAFNQRLSLKEYLLLENTEWERSIAFHKVIILVSCLHWICLEGKHCLFSFQRGGKRKEFWNIIITYHNITNFWRQLNKNCYIWFISENNPSTRIWARNAQFCLCNFCSTHFSLPVSLHLESLKPSTGHLNPFQFQT